MGRLPRHLSKNNSKNSNYVFCDAILVALKAILLF
jgi:hypothetical protein